MKKLLVTGFLMLSLAAYSQKPAKLYTEVKQDTVAYYADNSEIHPVSITFTGQPELENLKIPGKFETVKVLPPGSKRNRLITFIVTDRKKGWKIRKMPNYYTLAGDATIKAYDADYVYDLPFQKGKSFLMYQGYNGTFSHQNENSLDFTMPEGTEITAAREGKVIDVVQSNNTGCPSISCAHLANYVSIMHSDGTIAQYFHLKQNGVKVKAGDLVKKGDLIALSGNTGWTNGPHLHFVCFLPDASKPKQKNTLKTLFRTGEGTKSEYLSEKKTYLKQY
jgi:murein DD-endopeptidase MepM/ murein hydrolase activator NlpD